MSVATPSSGRNGALPCAVNRIPPCQHNALARGSRLNEPAFVFVMVAVSNLPHWVGRLETYPTEPGLYPACQLRYFLALWTLRTDSWRNRALANLEIGFLVLTLIGLILGSWAILWVRTSRKPL